MNQPRPTKKADSARNTPPMPSDWSTGFNGWNRSDSNPVYRIASGGKETPIYYPAVGWTLLLWDTMRSKQALYLYAADHIVYDIENYI